MNKELELFYFNILKNEVFSHFREDFNYVPEDPAQWKIMHINYFQEHLFHRTKGNFSDRWFYTYFKNKTDKIPRIDMLNILSEYAGYKDWDDFINEHIDKAPVPINNGTDSEENNPVLVPNKKSFISQWWLPITFFLVIVVSAGMYWYDQKSHTYSFYFRDNDRDDMKDGILVYIPSNTAEPKMVSDQDGKVTITSRKDTIEMIVQSPFYRKDTFLINLKLSDGVETIDLTPNEYALMMYYYSNSQNTAVERRRKELNQLIDNNALIYQVYNNENYGQEVLTKEQYINMMTAPTETLKNFVLISSEEKNGKITRIKFKIIPSENNQ